MNFLKSRGFLIGATALVVGSGVYLLMPKPPSPPDLPDPRDTPENCITMTRDQIVNSWLDPGWHSQANADYIPSMMFEPKIVGGRIVVEAYPVDRNCAPITAERINMTIAGPTCSFPAGLTLDKVRYDFTNADVDAWGDLIQFNFMRLIPQADSAYPTKLGFKMEFIKIKGGVEVPVARGDTKPCPPFCPTAG